MKSWAMVGLVVVLAGCSDEIGPDPSGGTGASTANSMGGNGGEGATGGGDAGGSSSTGGSTPGGGFESGERIKAKTLVGADGSRTPSGLYDSQLGIDCAWRGASDGQQRCLPVNYAFATIWADAACTIPVGTSNGTCGLPTHLLTQTGSCWDSVRVFPVAGPYAGTTYTKAGADCIDIGPTANAIIGGAEIPASSFVAATVEIEP
jgi:hypothetical protein